MITMKIHDYTLFFKNQNGFERLIEELYRKYKSYGKFVGKIKISNLSIEEANAFSKLLGYHLNNHDNVILSVTKLIKIMKETKYGDNFDLSILVSEYLNINLITNKENKLNNLQAEQQFYQNIIKNHFSKGNDWFKNVINNHIMPYNLIHKRYLKDKISLKKEIELTINLINNLPDKSTSLSIFSALYTKHPHYLDLDKNNNILFLYALAYLNKMKYPEKRIDKIKLLNSFNLMIDNISNFVITYNLFTNKDYLNEFAQNNETLILNIQNILKVDKCYSKKKRVFIFENPSILNEAIIKNVEECIIVTSGFLNLSVYLLLDKLIESGNKLYYNGDFDPEGLLIANNLKEKYQDNLELFCYEEIDYNNCVSKQIINNGRLNKLNNVVENDLNLIKKLLQKNKLAGYQENNKERIIKYINNS